MTVHYDDDTITLHHGDCIEVLRTVPDNSVDSVVTDPPYGLEFMGKDWDAPWSGRGQRPGGAGIKTGTGFTLGGNGYAGRETPSYGKPWVAKRCTSCGHTQSGGSPCKCEKPTWTVERQHPAVIGRGFQTWCEIWSTECLRVLKPGGYMVAFGGSRTWHRLAAAIEDSGFEIRDSIAWLYGSGFPKSLDVSKAIDKAAGVDRPVIGTTKAGASSLNRVSRVQQGYRDKLTDVTPDDLPITAPVTDAAREWEGWGTALKPSFEPIVVGRKPLSGTVASNVLAYGTGALNIDACRVGTDSTRRTRSASDFGLLNDDGWQPSSGQNGSESGRWPTNALLDESQAPELDRQSGNRPAGSSVRGDEPSKRNGTIYGEHERTPFAGHGDSGGASRFFPTFRYEAKAPTSERPNVDGVMHPTVKPLDLMRWLIRLVTPPNGVVLEPFAGSGTTAEACVHEHMKCIAIEREAEYLPLIVDRLTKPIEVGLDFGGFA